MQKLKSKPEQPHKVPKRVPKPYWVARRVPKRSPNSLKKFTFGIIVLKVLFNLVSLNLAARVPSPVSQNSSI